MAHHQLRAAAEAHIGPLLQRYSTQLSHFHSYVPFVLQPTHKYVPFAALDLFGAVRLSSVVNWIATGVFDPAPAAENGSASGEKGKKAKTKKERASLLQECFGILVVVFGGETFLGQSSLSGQ